MTATRYTKKDIQHYIESCNRYLDLMEVGYTLRYMSAYGGHGVARQYTTQNGTGLHMLIGYLPARECYRFVFGMYQALDMVRYPGDCA